MRAIFSEDFKKQYRKIKDPATRLRILKQIKKLESFPETGKPLQYGMKGHRTIRVPPFRIVYRLESDEIVLVCFDNRENVYN